MSISLRDDIVEAYVVFGMNVFEYERTEKQRILENQTDETTTELAESEKTQRRGVTDNEIGCVLRNGH